MYVITIRIRQCSRTLSTTEHYDRGRSSEIDFISPARKLNTWMLIVKLSIEKAKSLSCVVNQKPLIFMNIYVRTACSSANGANTYCRGAPYSLLLIAVHDNFWLKFHNSFWFDRDKTTRNRGRNLACCYFIKSNAPIHPPPPPPPPQCSRCRALKFNDVKPPNSR